MSKKLNFTLNEEQLAEIEQTINGSAYPEVRQSAIALHLTNLGHLPEQVDQGILVTSDTIYLWHKRWGG